MLNYAPYAKLCSAMLLLCKLCLMLGLCDYAKKQCWHNRAPPTLDLLVYAIQSQRDDRDMGRPNTRKIRPLPAWANFKAVGVRGERERQE